MRRAANRGVLFEWGLVFDDDKQASQPRKLPLAALGCDSDNAVLRPAYRNLDLFFPGAVCDQLYCESKQGEFWFPAKVKEVLTDEYQLPSWELPKAMKDYNAATAAKILRKIDTAEAQRLRRAERKADATPPNLVPPTGDTAGVGAVRVGGGKPEKPA